MNTAGAIGFGDYKKPIKNPNLLKLALLYTKHQEFPIFSYPLPPRSFCKRIFCIFPKGSSRVRLAARPRPRQTNS